ncbi:hypothetical protein ICN41_09060 [Polynucleobacter sp. 15G-AUS-farblos]|uniref:hypothetical protein n=1 Tax=Polynucleobacter sp. 15G-AUS-farblos TaxID=2689094 RepID=UPI001C0D95E2|nr:hypothetical protein [Polynucleobacter sp. 15G-AUS-farblos]MBU3584133.1 hypothetical protein [Polynucleobacter sp. 15G-AUS-farblos]
MKNKLKSLIKTSILKLYRLVFNFLNRHPRLHGKILYHLHKSGLHKKIKKFYYKSILKLNEEYSDQMIGPVIVDITSADLTSQAKLIYQQFLAQASSGSKEK